MTHVALVLHSVENTAATNPARQPPVLSRKRSILFTAHIVITQTTSSISTKPFKDLTFNDLNANHKINLYAHYILHIFLRNPNLSLQETLDLLNSYIHTQTLLMTPLTGINLPSSHYKVTTWMWKPTHHLSL